MAFTITMSVETQPTVKTYSPSEQGFQRLLLRENRDQSRSGEGWRRFGLNLTICAVATAADLGESHLVDRFIRNPLEEKMNGLLKDAKGLTLQKFKEAHKDKKEDFPTSQAWTEGLKNEKAAIHDKAQNTQGKKFAAEFVEEWGSDHAYAWIANNWVRLMTGVDGAKYVSETSAFIADWANTISQVFGKNKLYPQRNVDAGGKAKTGLFGIKLAYETADMINPVNVEAAFRVIEEIPVVGSGVVWLHEKSDKLIESTIGQLGNTAAAKAVLGYHIGHNLKKL